METSFYVDLDYDDCSSNVAFHDLLEAHFEKYVAGKELSKSNVKHIQCWCYHNTDKTAYNKFIAKAKKRFNLVGRASKTQRKQYGQIKGIIKNTDNMISYCLKDKNYTYKGLELDYIKNREELSYQKDDDPREKYDKFIEECKKMITFRPQQFAPTHYEDYLSRVSIGTEISAIWYSHYETVIPRSVSEKVLLNLGLICHEQIAKSRFQCYIGFDPSKML